MTYLPAWLLNRAHANRQEKIGKLKAQINRLENSQGLELIQELEGAEFKPGQFCWENLIQWLKCPEAKAIRIGTNWFEHDGNLKPTVELQEGEKTYRVLPGTVDLHGYETHVDAMSGGQVTEQ